MILNIVEVLVLICLSIVLVENNKNRVSRFFIRIISIYWIGLSIISIFNPFGLYEVSTAAYTIVFSGILSFILGYSVSFNKQIAACSKSDNITGTWSDVSYYLDNKKLQVLFLACLAEVLYLISNQWAVLLLQGSLSNVKIDMFELLFQNNSFLFFFYQAFVFPVFYISSVLSSYLIIQKRWSLKLLLLFIFVVLFCFLGGKRAYFATFFNCFIFVFIILKIKYIKRLIGSTKTVSTTFLIVLFALVFIGSSAITALYSNSDLDKGTLSEASNDVASQVVSYSIGPLRAFDYSLKHGYTEEVPLQMGLSSFGGMIEYYGTSILKRLGFNVKSSRELTMERLQEEFVPIAKDNNANFAYTSFIYFMYDFGIIGVFIISFLFGVFVKFSIYALIKYKTFAALFLLTYQFLACFMFLQSWAYIALNAQPFLIFCYCLNRYELKRRKHVQLQCYNPI